MPQKYSSLSMFCWFLNHSFVHYSIENIFGDMFSLYHTFALL